MTPTRLTKDSNPQPCLPFGRIRRANNYWKLGKIAMSLGTLPVLEGFFDLSRTKFDAGLEIDFSWGPVYESGMALPMLAFSHQLADSLMYWLANPCDPAIWAMLEAWDAAGTMAIAVKQQGKVFFVTPNFALQPGARELRAQALGAMKHSVSVEEFGDAALACFVSGWIESGSTSGIEGISKLRSVMACTVRTSTTGRVRVPAQDIEAAECGCLFLRKFDSSSAR